MVKNKKYELLRQTKSNIEGNFRIQTPLDSGTYFVFTEDQKGSKFRPEEVLLENGNDVQLSIVEIK